MGRRLWLIGGTQESRLLVTAILQSWGDRAPTAPSQLPPLLVSVTTEAARLLYPVDPAVQVWVGRVTEEMAPDFIRQNDIGAILDASHPFAVEISRRAIALAQCHQLRYLRFERAEVNGATAQGSDRPLSPNVLTLPCLDALLTEGYLSTEARTLLVLGYRMLIPFAPWQAQTTLFARILPSPIALTTALTAGFTPDRLIALRPPITPALEAALWQQWRITQVVIKASGQPGGEDVKRAIATRLGIRLLILPRPALAYPAQTDSIPPAVQFALAFFLSQNP